MTLKKEVAPREIAEYFLRYLDRVDNDIELISGFEADRDRVIQYFEAIPTANHGYRYAEGKWSFKEMLQHIVDTERIFMTRCFRIARNDKAALAGYDQDEYVAPSNADQKTMAAIIEEFSLVRACFLNLLKSLRPEDLARIGTACGNPMSSRAAAFTMLGHSDWHIQIMNERYTDGL